MPSVTEEDVSGTPQPIVLSIVIPFQNRFEYLELTIDSISAQGTGSWECILVDDGSDPSILSRLQDKVASDRRFRVIIPEGCGSIGPCRARNIGLAQAQGRFVWFFDSDDLMMPGAISAITEAIDAERIDLLIGQYACFGGSSTHERRMIMDPDPLVILKKHCMRESTINTAAAIWSKRFLLERADKKWPETLYQSEDYLFYAQLLSRAPRIAIIGQTLFRYRQHEGNISRLSSRKEVSDECLLDALEQRFIARVEVLALAISVRALREDRECLVCILFHCFDYLKSLRGSGRYPGSCRRLGIEIFRLPIILRLKALVAIASISVTGRGDRIVRS